jgi:Rox3 mediator complex subunit
LAASVARTDPITGEKRKMRKSYKSQEKAFELSGRNEPHKHEEGKPGGLMDLLAWPDEEWHIQKVSGFEVEKGFTEVMKAKLAKAVKMEAGDLPDFDASVLGLDVAVPIPQLLPQAKRPLPGEGYRTHSGTQSRTHTSGNTPLAQSDDPARPKRQNVRKRGYGEASFEGYGEGFVDDDDVRMGGYSTGDGDDRRGSGSRKKKRKVIKSIKVKSLG